jgi:hypothetical protein
VFCHLFLAAVLWCGRPLNVRGDQVLDFWKSHPEVPASSPADYLKELRSLGITNANTLNGYLTTNELAGTVLYSMLLLAPDSAPLDQAVIQNIIYVVPRLQQSQAKAKLTGMQLLLPYITSNEILTHFTTYFAIMESTESNDQILQLLGETSPTDAAKYRAAKWTAKGIIQARYMFQNGGMPVVGSNSTKHLIESTKAPFYSEPEMAAVIAQYLVARLKGSHQFVTPEDFGPTMEFLLHDSKADPDFIASKLSDLACSDTRLLSPVMWSLVQGRSNSVVAKEALDQFISQCKNDHNQALYQDIAKGKITKEAAYDQPLESVRRKHQDIPAH